MPQNLVLGIYAHIICLKAGVLVGFVSQKLGRNCQPPPLTRVSVRAFAVSADDPSACSTSEGSFANRHLRKQQLTRTKREYFNREAKKWIRWRAPLRNSTSTCPKSC